MSYRARCGSLWNGVSDADEERRPAGMKNDPWFYSGYISSLLFFIYLLQSIHNTRRHYRWGMGYIYRLTFLRLFCRELNKILNIFYKWENYLSTAKSRGKEFHSLIVLGKEEDLNISSAIELWSCLGDLDYSKLCKVAAKDLICQCQFCHERYCVRMVAQDICFWRSEASRPAHSPELMCLPEKRSYR